MEDNNQEVVQPPVNKTKVLYDAVSKDYNIGTFDEFSKKLQDPSKREAFYKGVGSEYNLGTFDEFSKKISSVEKKSPSGIISSPIPFQSPSPLQEDKGLLGKIPKEREALTQDLSLAGINQKFPAAADQKPQHDRSWTNFVQNAAASIEKSGTELAANTSTLLRDLSSNVLAAQYKVKKDTPELFDTYGNKTKAAEKVEDASFFSDPLGKVILGLHGNKQRMQEAINQNPLPDTFWGNAVQGGINIVPDLAATAVMPEAKAAQAATFMSKAGSLLFNNFTKYLAFKGVVSGYGETKARGGTTSEAAKAAGIEGVKGLGNGIEMAILGAGSNVATNAIMKQAEKIGLTGLKGLATKELVNLGTDIVAFGMVSPFSHAALDGRFATAKEIADGTGIAMIMRGKGALENLHNRSAINKSLNELQDLKKFVAVSNFADATPESIKEVYNGKESADELNLKALQYAKAARETNIPDQKQAFLIKAITYTKASNVKYIADMVVNNKEGYKAFEESGLDDNLKTTFLDKVNQVNKDINPLEISKTELGEKIKEGQGLISQLEQTLPQYENDPVAKAEITFKIDQAKKEVESHNKDLMGIIAKQNEQTGKKEVLSKPTQEQLTKDVKEGNFATFTYGSEEEVPDIFKDKISSRGENTLENGKKEPFVKVTIPQSLADYELSKIKNNTVEIPEPEHEEGLKDVESTHKAFNSDKVSANDFNKIKKLVPNNVMYGDDTKSSPQIVSEAYHKAKADGSNPELVKAVEDLLGKEKAKVEVKPAEINGEDIVKKWIAGIPDTRFTDEERKAFNTVPMKRMTELRIEFHKNIENTAKELDTIEKEKKDAYYNILKGNELKNAQELSELYHRSKEKGSNPELVKAIEDLLGKEKAPKVKEVKPTAVTPSQKREQKPLGDNISVGEVLDKTGTYKGIKGSFTQEGQTVVFKEEGKERVYEIGNIDEIKNMPISDFDIKHEESVTSIGDEGQILVRGEEYKNNFSDPLMAINRDANGNILSVNLETADGKKRTFKGNIAEDLAYQIHLKEINKNNETKSEFEKFINEDEGAQKEIDNAGVPEVTKTNTTETNAKISGEKVNASPEDEHKAISDLLKGKFLQIKSKSGKLHYYSGEISGPFDNENPYGNEKEIGDKKYYSIESENGGVLHFFINENGEIEDLDINDHNDIESINVVDNIEREKLPVYNAEDIKKDPELIKKDRDRGTIGYNESFVRLSTTKSSIPENSKIGDIIDFNKKKYVIESIDDSKKGIVSLYRVDENGNLLREQDLSKKERKAAQAKEEGEEEEPEEKKLPKNKKQENAIQKPSTSSLLQHPQEGVGKAGGKRKGVEQGKQGNETPEKGKQVKGNEKKVNKYKNIPKEYYAAFGSEVADGTVVGNESNSLFKVPIDGNYNGLFKDTSRNFSDKLIERVKKFAIDKGYEYKGIEKDEHGVSYLKFVNEEYVEPKVKEAKKVPEKEFNDLLGKLIKANYAGLKGEMKGFYSEVAQRYFEGDERIIEVVNDALGIENKEAPKAEAPKPEAPKVKPRQERINDLVDKAQQLQKMRANSPERAAEVNRLKFAAKEVGLEYRDDTGKLHYIKSGEKVQKREAVVNKAIVKGFDKENYSKQTNDVVDALVESNTANHGLDIIGTDGKRLSAKQNESALKSIREGKPNQAAKIMYDFIENANEQGGVELTDPITKQRVLVPVKDYLESVTSEEKKVNDWLKQQGEEQLDIPDEHIENIIKQHEAEFKAENQQPTPEGEAKGGSPIGEGDGGKENIAEKAKIIADKIRGLKIKQSGLQSNIMGVPIFIYNNVIETVATVYEKGGSLAQAIHQAISKHKLGQIKDFEKDVFIKSLEDSTGEKYSPEEGKFYEDYQDVLNKVGKKVQEKAKLEFIERNFDTILKKLKIDVKCP